MCANTHQKVNAAELTPDDSRPLFVALQELYDSQFLHGSEWSSYAHLPHICWMMPEEPNVKDYRPLNEALRTFSGEADWYLISDHPRICLFAQPRTTGSYQADEFRKASIADSLELARHLAREFRLSLSNNTSVTIHHLASDSVGLDYQSEHSGKFFIVSDPDSFSPRTLTLTSPSDRALHFGLSSQELCSLSSEIEPRRDRFEILGQFTQSQADVRVKAGDVNVFAKECLALESSSENLLALQAAKKLRSIVESAFAQNLGLYLEW